ncbi:glutathione S-transferase family protein [Arhodomonas sp. SL1]|uniref:glutathione S-transferase family protein n=1 Tax=Arhodomonas sp. SL1 TaxID=3425691 RepID=UPI003F8822F9
MELYDKPECPFCWRVRMALRWQGRAYRHRRHDDPEAVAERQRLSPHGTVPILHCEELVLTDSRVILEYLADSGPGLLPGDAEGRARVRTRLDYIDGVLGKAIREVVFEKRDRPVTEWDRARIDAGIEGWCRGLPALEAELDADGRFPEGDSLADLALLTRCGLAAAYGVELPMELTRLRRWYERWRAAPVFRETAPPRVRDALSAM